MTFSPRAAGSIIAASYIMLIARAGSHLVVPDLVNVFV